MPRFHSHGVMSRSSGCLIALVLGLHAAAFVGVGKLFTEEQRVPKTNLRAVDVAAEPEVDTQALLTGERYIASNRFMVREGAEAAFEQRWAKRKSSLLTLPGFRWFSLMRRLPNDQQSFPDEYSYVSFTIWETKKDFTFWRKGPAFKEAHGGGGILDFVGMVMSSFMTSKGPPKPSFWRGLLPLKSAEQRDRFLQIWSPIHHSIAAFQAKLSERQYVPTSCERGPDRALTAWQIFELMSEFKQYIRDRNLYYIDSNIIHPLTRECQLSLAELLGPSRVQWFVSHYWGTSFAYTCDALRRHAENAARQSGTTWQSVSYWICAFSNNQYRIEEELGATHKESSFYLALHSSCVHGTCMVLDETALPLTRSWCLFELLQTMNLEKERKDFQGLQFCTNTGVVNLGQATTEVAINIGRQLAVLSLADAKATRAKDRDTIRSLVIQEMGGFEQIDSKLRMHIRDALMVCREAIECSFNDLCDRLERTGHRSVSLMKLSSL